MATSRTSSLPDHVLPLGCLYFCQGTLRSGKAPAVYCAAPGCVAAPGVRRVFHLQCIRKWGGDRGAAWVKRAKKEPSQWFCPSCLASAADREDFLSQEGQLKRKKPAQKKKEAEQPKKKEGKHGPCPYCKGAKTKMEYGNYRKHLLEIHHCDMDGNHACLTCRYGCQQTFYRHAERTAHEQACKVGMAICMAPQSEA